MRIHLAEDEQLPGGSVATDAGDNGGRDDGDADVDTVCRIARASFTVL